MTDALADGLSRRASTFVRTHGHRLVSDTAQRSVAEWITQGLDRGAVHKTAEHERQWGNLYLPPSLAYNGGPRYLGGEAPTSEWASKGCIEAGPSRVSTSYEFLIDDSGSFGVGASRFVPLYSSVEGWIEALALEYAVRGMAAMVRRMSGPDLAALDLSRMEPFPGIPGISDSWLIDEEAIVFVCRGRALLSKYPDDEFAVSYSGIADRDLNLDLRYGRSG